MTEARFDRICNEALEYIREQAPKDSGNLAYNAIKMIRLNPETYRIYVEDAIAPYMPYTNEPWVSAYWRGKQNPNLYWWDKACRGAMDMVAKKLKGEIKRKDTPPEDLDEAALAADYQNTRGDLFEEDIWLNSVWLENYDLWDNIAAVWPRKDTE